ncbi:MAG TPA: MarR family transcriptional regulator [Candidatus Limnocylindria bacterium]|nr:MarR family transcriptional regulator [Candidatus Limnocylindria bacterium]
MVVGTAPTMQEFWRMMKGLTASARQAINARLEGVGLSSAAGDIVFHLIPEEGGLSQEELCRRLGVGKAAVSRTVDALVSKGYTRREAHPKDARAHLVLLTDTGREAGARVAQAYGGVFGTLMRGISPEELAGMARLLERIRRNLAEGQPAE